MTSVIHPKPDEHGNPVVIHHPSVPTSPETWENPRATATWSPCSLVPTTLNDVTIKQWREAPTCDDGWKKLADQAHINEPPMPTKGGKAPASGCVTVEPDGRVWIVSPTNKFGGYANTFPKGKTEGKLPLQADAIKEAFEKPGLPVELPAFVGDFERTTSVTRYYLARRVGGSPADMSWESQAVHLVPKAELSKFLNHAADADLLNALAAVLAKA
jgi:ADP-ribose pyrophosphatase YjhB (NUDIX family)